VIENESVAAWTSLNNTFAGGHVNLPAEGSNRDFWRGLLFQLGRNGTDDFEFTSIVLEKDDGTEVVMKKDDFTWMNVVAKWAKGENEDGSPIYPDSPMDPDDALHLYPSKSDPSWDALLDCVKTENDQGDEIGCDLLREIDEENTTTIKFVWSYLRGHKIHVGLHPKNIITFWQSPAGYNARVSQEAGRFGTANRLEISFEEQFTVKFYKQDGMDSEMLPLVDVNDGLVNVSKIMVKYAIAEPESGSEQAPVWGTGGP